MSTQESPKRQPQSLPEKSCHPINPEAKAAIKMADKTATADPFADLSSLVVAKATGCATKTVIHSIPVAKPPKNAFVMVHERALLDGPVLLIKDDDDGQLYLVVPGMQGVDALADFVRSYELHLYVKARTGTPGVWPLVVPDDTNPNMWHSTAIDCAERARKGWIRLQSDRGLGGYVTVEPTSPEHLGAPKWPASTHAEIIKLAFKDRLVRSLAHPVAKKLLGAE